MKKLLYLFLAGATMFATSCKEDFLEVNTWSIVSPDGVYDDPDNIFLGLDGVYAPYYDEWSPHHAIANVPTLDVQADGWDAELATHSWGVEAKSGFFKNAWSQQYKQISRANNFLRDIANVPESVMPKAKLEIYEAEARAIRAYAYYYLTTLFSRVPMLLTGESYATAPDKARPETDDEAWALIKEDFDYAVSKLDWKPADGMKGRWTKGAALAFSAKADMYMKDFNSAKRKYAELEASGVYQLNPVFAMTSWVDNPWNVEAVFEISYPQFTNMASPWSERKNNDIRFFDQQTRPREYGGWGDSFTSFELVRSFEPGDKRKLYSVITGVGGPNPNPFQPDLPVGNIVEGGSNPYIWQEHYLADHEYNPNNHSLKLWKTNKQYSSNNFNIYRYAGVLLDYAECCFRTGDAPKGWDLLNQIRDRAWGNLEVGATPNDCGSILHFDETLLNTVKVEVPDAQTYYTQYKADKGYKSDVWLVALFQERRKELYYEYSLWYDMCRCDFVEEWLDCEYPKNNNACFYNVVTKQYYYPEGGIDKNAPWDNASPEERANMIPVTGRDWDWNPIHLVYPIPTSELTANKLMVQNEGY